MVVVYVVYTYYTVVSVRNWDEGGIRRLRVVVVIS